MSFTVSTITKDSPHGIGSIPSTILLFCPMSMTIYVLTIFKFSWKRASPLIPSLPCALCFLNIILDSFPIPFRLLLKIEAALWGTLTITTLITFNLIAFKVWDITKELWFCFSKKMKSEKCMIQFQNRVFLNMKRKEIKNKIRFSFSQIKIILDYSFYLLSRNSAKILNRCSKINIT